MPRPQRYLLSAGVAAMAMVLVLVVPASAGTTWSDVARNAAGISGSTLALLALLWIAGLTCNSVALAASLPGLTTRRALMLSLSGSAVANVLPLGGAAGVGLNYTMTRRWGFSRSSFAAYTVTTNVCDVAAKVIVIAAASIILLAGGDDALLQPDLTTVLAALVALPLLLVLVLHRPSAAGLGRLLDRLTSSFGTLRRRPWVTDLGSSLPRVAGMTTTLFRRRWPRLTAGTFAYVALQAALLWGCLHAAGLDLDLTSLACALAVDRLLTMLPLTPGGVGIVEGGVAAALTALGAAPEPVITGVLLYRAYTYLAEIPVGGLTAVVWTMRYGGSASLQAPSEVIIDGATNR